MTNCQDLCTAVKCQELEERIASLESIVGFLQATLVSHLSQDIPLAHDYDPPPPSVLFDIFPLPNGSYVLKVTVDGASDQDTLSLTAPSVLFDIFPVDDNKYDFKVTVNGETDSDTLVIPPPSVSFDISSQQEDKYDFKLTVNDETYEDSLTVTHPTLEPEEPEAPQSDLDINGSYFDGDLTITVSNGNSTDSVQINIPQNNSTTIVNNPNIETEIDNIKDILEQCCNDISAILNLLYNVRDEVTISVSGDSYNIICTEEEYKQQQDSPLIVPKTEITAQTINGNGLQGIASLISDLTTKVKEIDHRTCISQAPNFNFTSELPLSCEAALQNQTIEDYIAANPNLSWLQFLIDELRNNGVTGNNLKINNNYHIYLIYMLHLIHEQQKNIIAPVCELESQDTVAIVASDRVINRVRGKQLILHFVTLDNYPKRQANSSYRPVQIPSPIPNDQLDWMTNFESLRWHQGNLYAELELQNSSGDKINPPVSGFFENIAAADSYFNAVLGLTTFSEYNRKYHPNTSPPKVIPVQETRPYRAFVTFINSSGKAEVETKFQPIN